MKTEKIRPFAHAMAFYHEDGLPAAWKQAVKFAGKGGRVATMPDIIAARLETKPGDMPWETYFTTLTAEYFGYSKNGTLILIVAHGVGPMSTIEGIQQAYGWEYKDKSRSRRGGRVTEQEFWNLEAGKFGEVSIIDVVEYSKRYEYPFIQVLRLSEALTDPVVKARFGLDADKYVLAHAEHARAWHREQAGFDPNERYIFPESGEWIPPLRFSHRARGSEDSDPYIIQVDGADNCSYGSRHFGFRKIEPGYAVAHLISTSRLNHLCHQGNESLTVDVGCHEWWNGVRVVGIQAGGSIRSGLRCGPDAYKLLRKHWPELLEPMKQLEDVGFRALVQVGSQWFTQYPKVGERLDTWEPEYVVTSIEKTGKPALFRTTVGGYHGFFKFGINEVRAIAPFDANAYSFVSEPTLDSHSGDPMHQTAMVQFYKITIDGTKRMMRSHALAHDYERMMALLQKEAV